MAIGLIHEVLRTLRSALTGDRPVEFISRSPSLLGLGLVNPELGPTGLFVRVPSFEEEGGGSGAGCVLSSNNESFDPVLVSRLDKLS